MSRRSRCHVTADPGLPVTERVPCAGYSWEGQSEEKWPVYEEKMS